MSDKHLEALSALMDGEATELEVRRVLGSLDQDQVLGQKWARYQLVSSVLRGETQGRAQQWLDLDVSARVAQALEAEPAWSGAAPRKRLGARVIRPFANVAVAASVSAAVILGWQSVQSPVPAASGPVAFTLPASQGGATLAAVSDNGLMQVSQGSPSRSAPAFSRQDIIRYNPDVDDQLNEYLISHSSNAAVNTAAGVAPYARVVALRPVKAVKTQQDVRAEK